MVLDAAKIELLFNDEKTEDLISFLEVFNSYVSKVCNGDSYDEEENTLHSMIEKIDGSKILERLEEYLKL